MITHKEARESYKRLFDSYSGDYWAPFPTRSDLDTYRNYIIQQEKKDKLLELYKTIATEPYEVDYSVYWKQIQALEEELKWE